MAKFKLKTFNFLLISLISAKQSKLKKNNYHFYMGFLFQTFKIHRAAREWDVISFYLLHRQLILYTFILSYMLLYDFKHFFVHYHTMPS